MIRALACITLVVLLPGAAFHQDTGKPPAFDLADVHASAPSTSTLNSFMKGPFIGGGRYEVRTASMLDLVRTAYSLEPDKVVGGPNWLEADRFDVVAKAAPGSTPDTMKIMLQTLLAERFKLVVHDESRPMPAYALKAGKKPLLKQADGTGETGCKLQPQP